MTTASNKPTTDHGMSLRTARSIEYAIIGLCLIAASLAVTAGIGTGWVSIIALLIVPITFIVIWRSVDVAARSFDGDRTGGVASARRIIDLGHQQNLRTA